MISPRGTETDYEKRCISLTQKVDSLVKFLEEERALRKDAESQVKQKNEHIRELEQAMLVVKKEFEHNLENEKGLGDNLLKMKEENDRFRRDKVELLDEKQ